MLVNGKNYTTIWVDETDKKTIKVIDQRKIPFEFSVLSLQKIDD